MVNLSLYELTAYFGIVVTDDGKGVEWYPSGRGYGEIIYEGFPITYINTYWGGANSYAEGNGGKVYQEFRLEWEVGGNRYSLVHLIPKLINT